MNININYFFKYKYNYFSKSKIPRMTSLKLGCNEFFNKCNCILFQKVFTTEQPQKILSQLQKVHTLESVIPICVSNLFTAK